MLKGGFMKRTIPVIIALVIFCLLVVFSVSCSKKSPAETVVLTPTATGTITRTSTITPTPTITQTATLTSTISLYIDGRITTGSGMGGNQVMFFISFQGTPYPNATVVVDGTLVPYISDSGDSSQYRNYAIPYTYGKIYAVTITAQGATATDLFLPAPGNVSASPDWQSITWANEGNNDRVSITGPGTYSNGPDLISPETIPPSVFVNTGTYHLNVTLENYKIGDMGSPEIIVSNSILRAYEYHTDTMTK
jgi:hypothetical protein